MPENTGATLFAAGDVIAGRYEVQALLGQGGMGAVFRVHDRELDEEIALKVLHPALSLDGRALERFRREVKLARRVTHPNVARTFDLGFDRVRFLTMELVAGEAVSALVRDGARPPLSEALRIAEGVSRGLSAAHAAGVVHRDLKPDNVMRGPGANGRVVITDFGIARLAVRPEADEALRRTGDQIVGTPAYMAPEQITAQAVDGRTDVYSLGAMCFELLTGRLPFVRDSAMASAAARLMEDAPDVRTLAPDVPESIAELVKSMLARRREDRPDAETVLQSLERVRGSRDERRTRVATAPTIAATRRVVVVVAVAPIGDLAEAIADGLSSVRGVELVAPAAVGDAMKESATPLAAARALGAALVVDGSVRSEGDVRRARIRLVATDEGRQVWASAPIDGAVNEGFAFEDRVVQAVVEGVRNHIGSRAPRGPDDPVALDLYERARSIARARTVPALNEAIALLEDALRRFPRDAFIMGLLGVTLIRVYGMTGARSHDLAARGEDLTLRALALDSSIGESYFAIGVLRLEQGEVRASARALEEAIARSPGHAEAHAALGIILCDTGRVEEAMRRFDTALALDPLLAHGWMERARVRAMLGDRAGAEEDLARAEEVSPGATKMVLVRAVVWWRDRARAAELVEQFERAPSGAAWERAAPFLRAYARGERLPLIAMDLEKMAGDSSFAPRNASRIIEVATELLAEVGDRDYALKWLERIEDLPFVDVFWLDRCPNLAALREDPIFARVRARVAANAADVWR
jgi:tetratricopeptide (TPR) repeat protein/TolB-like protein